jgi:hypothetical protein
MKRRDFIKTVGLSCVGSCFNPLGVFAAGTTPVNNRAGYTAAFPPLRLNPLSTSAAGITSIDDMAWDPGPLLERFDGKKQARRELYLQIFGEDEIDDILDEMRDSYEALIPKMPYIGERNFHLVWFLPNCQKLAEYLAVERYGVTKREFSHLHLTQASKDLLAIPEDQLIAAGRGQFGPKTERQMAAWALWSQFRVYPGDYIYRFRKGDGINFDWGFDYTQCANAILYEQYDALDLLLQMVCTQDYIAGSAMRTGYSRTMEIATGAPICDLRWKLEE